MFTDSDKYIFGMCVNRTILKIFLYYNQKTSKNVVFCCLQIIDKFNIKINKLPKNIPI